MDASVSSGNLVSSQTISPSTSIINIPAIWLIRTLPPSDTLLDEGFLKVHTTTFVATSLAFWMARWPEQVLNYPSIANYYPDPSIIVRPNSTASDQLMSPSFRVLGSSPGDHVFYAGSEYADAEGKYKLRTDVSTQGYGYHLDQTTKIIAISVLAAYCLYILIFVILMLTLNRVHSNAWDSIGELTALAIMSRPDNKLRNTSAGIETVALFKLPVNIRANDDNHLEILFGDDEGSARSGVVEKDKVYELLADVLYLTRIDSCAQSNLALELDMSWLLSLGVVRILDHPHPSSYAWLSISCVLYSSSGSAMNFSLKGTHFSLISFAIQGPRISFTGFASSSSKGVSISAISRSTCFPHASQGSNFSEMVS
ncbi:hypothetical protein KCU65_g356, partial [Aureobasidium melanogenum]